MTDHSTIARRIDEALEGRRAHRADVEALCSRLETLDTRFGQLVSDVRSLADLPGDSAFCDEVRASAREAFVHGQWGEKYTADLKDDLRSVTAAARIIRTRIERDVINLGVVGMMKAGKSTALRSFTGLGRNVIPSEELGATTAALSRIINDLSAARARLVLHTWESFRAEYLAPLHQSAGLAAAPDSIDAFASYQYPREDELSQDLQSERQYLKKLHEAQISLPSYRADLGSGTKNVSLDELRPYVAYPAPGERVDHRPYHAVREVYIHTALPDVPDAKIGLVDLPGSGEAGLKVDEHFLNRLHNDVDLILMVKAPGEGSADMTGADWKIVDLAKNARCGVPMEYFFIAVLNKKFRPGEPTFAQQQKSFDYTSAKVTSALSPTGVTILEANLAEVEEARQDVLLPVLTHLATHLHSMDQAAMDSVISSARSVFAGVIKYCDALIRECSRWHGTMGDENIQLRRAASTLVKNIGKELRALAKRYDAEAARNEPDIEMMKAVEVAEKSIQGWLPSLLKSDDLADEASQGMLTAVEVSFRDARTHLHDAYADVRPSVEASIGRLHMDIATVLQNRLTAQLVPDTESPDALDRLEQSARDSGALIIANALAELSKLDEGYGNAVLRVGRPLIRRVQRDEPQAPLPGQSAVTSREEKLRRLLDKAPAGDVPNSDSGSEWSIPQNLAELQAALEKDVSECLVKLREALATEARGLVTVLACAADLFADRIARTNAVAEDYEMLCRLHRVEVWPDVFGGSAARTHEAVMKLEASVRSLRDELAGMR